MERAQRDESDEEVGGTSLSLLFTRSRTLELVHSPARSTTTASTDHCAVVPRLAVTSVAPLVSSSARRTSRTSTTLARPSLGTPTRTMVTVLILGGLGLDPTRHFISHLLSLPSTSPHHPSFVRIVDKALAIPQADAYTTYVDTDCRKALRTGVDRGTVELVQGNLLTQATRDKAFTLPDNFKIGTASDSSTINGFDWVFDFSGETDFSAPDVVRPSPPPPPRTTSARSGSAAHTPLTSPSTGPHRAHPAPRSPPRPERCRPPRTRLRPHPHALLPRRRRRQARSSRGRRRERGRRRALGHDGELAPRGGEGPGNDRRVRLEFPHVGRLAQPGLQLTVANFLRTGSTSSLCGLRSSTARTP